MKEREKGIGIKISDRFYYDETSSTCLRNKVEVRAGRYSGTIVAAKDAEAGGFSTRQPYNSKVTTVSYLNKRYIVSRIIWELFNGPIPEGMVIDHLNGDPWDNRISNLECKTLRQNSQNSKKSKLNTSGRVGLEWVIKQYNSGIYYTVVRARLRKESGDIDKTFNTDTLGLLPAWRDACIWRQEQVKIANTEGHMFTERHLHN